MSKESYPRQGPFRPRAVTSQIASYEKETSTSHESRFLSTRPVLSGPAKGVSRLRARPGRCPWTLPPFVKGGPKLSLSRLQPGKGRYHLSPFTASDSRHNPSLGTTLSRGAAGRVCLEPCCCYSPLPQHFLYFFPLPQGHGSFRPTFFPWVRTG